MDRPGGFLRDRRSRRPPGRCSAGCPGRAEHEHVRPPRFGGCPACWKRRRPGLSLPEVVMIKGDPRYREVILDNLRRFDRERGYVSNEQVRRAAPLLGVTERQVRSLIRKKTKDRK